MALPAKVRYIGRKYMQLAPYLFSHVVFSSVHCHTVSSAGSSHEPSTLNPKPLLGGSKVLTSRVISSEPWLRFRLGGPQGFLGFRILFGVKGITDDRPVAHT